MPSEVSGVALVTGGGRGIGRGVALELAAAGMRVAVSARTRSQVEETGREVDGLGVEADVSRPEDVKRLVAETERQLGPVDLLVANAGITATERGRGWELPIDDWWHVYEVNVLGIYLTNRAVLPGMIERGRGRIVNVASGAAYLPGSTATAYAGSKAAVYRYSETLATQLREHGIAVFPISPGLVRTEMTEDTFPADAPWTPPELAPRLVRELATGRFDRLSGRYLHAEHDADFDELERRIPEILENDLNAIRLRR